MMVLQEDTLWSKYFITLTSLPYHVFPLSWLKLALNHWISQKDLKKRKATLALIDVDADPFLVFSVFTYHFQNKGIVVFWL